MRTNTLLVLFVFLSLNISRVCSQNQTENRENVVTLPYDRYIKPAGKLLIMGDSAKESHALDCVLSPDEKWLAVQERYSLVIISTKSNKIACSLSLDSITGIPVSMSSFSGILWYKTHILISIITKSNQSFVARLGWDGKSLNKERLFSYAALSPAKVALPNGLLINQESGRTFLYVVLNGNNQLVKQDFETGDTIWAKNTGVAPYGIAMAGNKLYVSNWAGRIPDASEKNVAGVPWGKAKIDPLTGACSEGSVSVFEPETGNLLDEIIVGLHPNSIISSPDGSFVYLTNSNSDEVSVINCHTDKVSETISLTLQADINSYFGDSPNGLAISSNGKILYVANGMDNALAVISLGKNACKGGLQEKSIVDGFIPTAAYPSAISIKDNKRLYVCNLESFGPNRAFAFKAGHPPVYNSHRMLASISVIDIPSGKQLAGYTKTVIAANQLERLQSAELPPRPGVLPKPIPERIGEPSVFNHVLYIIRENRTYDQVLGDVPEGNGDTSLCIFGKQVTPNIHQLVSEYQLMDNFFVSGKCSAEGHSWTDASIVTDYIEKDVRSWFRSYPHTLNDALVYNPMGFIWDNARNHGLSVRIYGEAATPHFADTLSWSDIYSGFLQNKPFQFTNTSTLNTVRDLLSPGYPGYDGHKIPDILRAKTFIDELHQYEAMGGDSLPQLMVMALPNDHTGGTRPGLPTPRAMIADNDLALGRIIQAVSESRFWKNTVIFIVEDDSQAGWDHVSVYRTVALVVSPYSKLQTTVSLPYNQPSMVRSIEQILGLPPMNIQDAIATPMFACFNESPDFSAYQSLENEVPIDEMNAALEDMDELALKNAKLSLEQQFEGIDTGDDQVFNRILWYYAKGNVSYPKKYSGEDDD
ncbi:MAG: beta-propeller fold lactonase family protein [Bacteroidales bacterium]|nr:beta-propeller fold lactonase family protein [Bacteroidales bacterium]